MEHNSTSIFPFKYIDFPTKDGYKKPFIEQVEHILENDIQKEDSFGCKIKNCHTHAGSKIHFNDFIEAELLFHNSNYNKSFARLTCDWIKTHCLNANNKFPQINNILLIGYEKYSELYLQELKDIIQMQIGMECGYCVYESIAETQSDGSRKNKIILRNLEKYLKDKIIIKNSNMNCGEKILNNKLSILREFEIAKTLCIFIVPINTTLSTMDKMVAEFMQSISSKDDKNGISSEHEVNREHICLITLAGALNANDYWKLDLEEKDYLIPATDSFEYLKNTHRIKNIVFAKTDWALSRKCKHCFPPNLTDEKPMFGVNRGSIVPMLKVGTAKTLEPIDYTINNKSSENLFKVCALSECLVYQHTLRGDNHYQYYLNTDEFIKKDRPDIENTLKKIQGFTVESSSPIQIFDYLVAPRHESNAEWVHIIHKNVFNGTARIIYFDVEKEYRSNLKAKYSDLICGLNNIKESGQKFLVRFHFVDDTILSGANFLRAKNLIVSLTNEIENVIVFHSAFILVNRLSLDTRKFYLDNVNHFFSYADVNISPMRSYEDACTLCKLIADYYNIRKQCATNTLAELCTNVIITHKLSSFSSQQSTVTSVDYDKEEKKLLFFIAHLLNERLSNKLVLTQIEESYPIDAERSSVEIEKLLYLYFNNGPKIISDYTSFNDVEELVWKISFIKAISRPFFIYHIRQRQAVFSFCLKTLNELLNYKTKKNKQNCVLVQSLVKALADLNANYLIRNKIINKLLNYAKKGDNYKNHMLNTSSFDLYCKNRLLTSKSLLHYIKKDIVLSRDTTKSLLLEHVLLKKNEKEFFGAKTPSSGTSSTVKFIDNNLLTTTALLYLENNVILKDGLTDTDTGNNLEKLKSCIQQNSHLYFFNNLNDLWKLNTSKDLTESSQVLECYGELINNIKNFASQNHKTRSDFSNLIDKLFNALNQQTSVPLQTLAFVYDNCESNRLFQFFTLAGNPVEGTEILANCKFKNLKTTQAFFCDDNLNELRNNLNNETTERKNDIFFIKDTLTESSTEKKSVIVRFSSDVFPDDSENKKSNESIYLQIWGFDDTNLCHWFSLKLLLTLRDHFSKLIKSINLQELINERKLDMQKNALSINKATTHADAEKYFKLVIFSDYSKSDYSDLFEITNKPLSVRKQYLDAINIRDKDYHFMLYDTYYQLLSDEFISSLYRKLIKGENVFQTELNKIPYGRLKKYVKTLFYCGDEDLESVYKMDKINTEMYFVREGQKIKMNFKFSDSNYDNRKCNLWESSITSIKSIFYIIILMSMNVVQHSREKKRIHEVNILFNGSGVVHFENKLKDFTLDEIKTLKNSIEKYTKIPPWLFKDNHTTLWTLIQAKSNSINTDNSGIKFSICEDPKNKESSFVITYDLFNGKVRQHD